MMEENEDFANDGDIQRSQKLKRAHDELIEECVNLVRDELRAEATNPREISHTWLYKSFIEPGLVDCFACQIGKSELHIYHLEYQWSVQAGKLNRTGKSECFVGELSLNSKYPPTCIVPETIQFRIADWFRRQDVDFPEYRKFSRTFHVVTQDREKLKQDLKYKNIDVLASYPRMELEINGASCLFRVCGEPMDKENTNVFIELANVLAQLFS
jgi:hypothetical protein